jgi:hypothetical protein
MVGHQYMSLQVMLQTPESQGKVNVQPARRCWEADLFNGWTITTSVMAPYPEGAALDCKAN